jgi:hypothetical protein
LLALKESNHQTEKLLLFQQLKEKNAILSKNLHKKQMHGSKHLERVERAVKQLIERLSPHKMQLARLN